MCFPGAAAHPCLVALVEVSLRSQVLPFVFRPAGPEPCAARGPLSTRGREVVAAPRGAGRRGRWQCAAKEWRRPRPPAGYARRLRRAPGAAGGCAGGGGRSALHVFSLKMAATMFLFKIIPVNSARLQALPAGEGSAAVRRRPSSGGRAESRQARAGGGRRTRGIAAAVSRGSLGRSAAALRRQRRRLHPSREREHSAGFFAAV